MSYGPDYVDLYRQSASYVDRILRGTKPADLPVQTPSKWFPVEAHTAMPFWWFYPAAMRRMFLRQWRKKLPLWSDAMAATRVLTRERLLALFPEARMYVEWVGGIPKSYAAYVPRA